MSVHEKLHISHLSLNRRLVTLMPDVGARFEVYERLDRHYCYLYIKDNIDLEVDIVKSIADFKYCNEGDSALVLGFTFTLRSIPNWLSAYRSAENGCLQTIVATLKVEATKSNYDAFVRVLRSIIPPALRKCLDIDGSTFWNERSQEVSTQMIKSINFKLPLFPSFSPLDLERLKDDNNWLSDTPVTFGLLFQVCVGRGVWGNLKIKLMDTTFWEKLAQDPDRYRDGFMKKNNLLECDFAVMPMFKLNHWRLGIIEKPAEFLQGNTVFHILDSLQDDIVALREGNQLQKILLKHFDDATFMDGRITTNIAQVPLQTNSKDCACFTIFFGQKFLSDPDATIALLKRSFPSVSDRLVAWGLQNSNLTFIRREIRSLLYQYVHHGDAVVEFEHCR